MKISFVKFLTVAVLLTATVSLSAQLPQTKLKPSQTVLLYPQGQNAKTGLAEARGPHVSNGVTREQEIDQNGNIRYAGDKASFNLYFPKKPNGMMVIVCPGGGYAYSSSYNEGTYVAEWLVSKGITACIVNYRMPNGHWEVPITDVKNTFRYCRAHAGEWKVDKIGIMGFSAGGHLAASASTLFLSEKTRPDFSVLVYPVITMDPKFTHKGTRNNLLGKDEFWNNRNVKVDEWEAAQRLHSDLQDIFSLENQVGRDTPPTFIVCCQDDTVVPVENSVRYYRALTMHRIPAEIHIYPTGGHGWGFKSEKYVGKGNDRFSYARPAFEAALLDWLKRL